MCYSELAGVAAGQHCMDFVTGLGYLRLVIQEKEVRS